MSYLSAIYDAMESENIQFMGEILSKPGEWQRFHSCNKEEPNQHVYVYIYPGSQMALIGDWTIHERSISVKLSNKPLTRSEKIQITLLKKKQDRERRLQIKACQAIWSKSIEPNCDHAYLKRKHILPYHIRQYNNFLICPLLDKESNIVGLQSISPSGQKKFHKGSILRGSFNLIGDKVTDVIRIVEGYATGISIHMATDDLICVSYSSKNLRHVVATMHSKFPKQQIIICADPKPQEINDAIIAARQIGCLIRSPLQLTKEYMDYNDIHVNYGLEALEGQMYLKNLYP